MSSSQSAAEAAGPESHQHTRSFGGCDTCRRRRIKCDESRPGCTRCHKSRLTCPGYTKSIVFHIGNESCSDRHTGFRRPLLSEAARREMSKVLVTSVPGNVTDCLKQIDEESLQAEDTRLEIIRGPFNVFAAIREKTPQIVPLDEIPSLFDQDDSFLSGISEMPQLNIWDTELDLDFESILTSPELQRDHAASTFLTAGQPGSYESAIQQTAPEGLDTNCMQHDLEQLPNDITSSLPTKSHISGLSTIPRSPEVTNRVMQDMLFLINHFTNTVITYLTPWRHEKTPWHILFVPQVRECAALLMLNAPVSYADQAIFNGFSAISALSIGGTCSSQMWLDKGEEYRRKSYEACQIMLQGAYDTPKKYKYKRILMALQVAVLMSTLKGDPVTEEYYFLETEKLIKLKGLGRKNSRKVRMLHRFYAYERLIYESTCMRGIDFTHRRRIKNDVNSVSIIPYPDDNMAFRVPDWGSLDKRGVDSEEDPEASTENEILGLWPDALCAKVAGIPEQWITVLLHIVLLGKHKDAVEQAGRSDTEHLQEFLSRAKTLETCIQKQVLQVDLASIPYSLTGREVLGNAWHDVLDCFRHALHIYFYRRIYDVSSLWLQDKVDKVRHCLSHIAQGHPQSGDPQLSGSVGVLWASFVASCEAEGEECQDFFDDWYRQAARKTGMSTWLNSLSLSRQIWEAKRTEGGRKTTWIDVLREQQRDILQHMPSQHGVCT